MTNRATRSELATTLAKAIATEARFDYAGPFKTLIRADEVMADLYANGEICDGEHPLIEGRKVRVIGGIRSEYRTRYYITLPL